MKVNQAVSPQITAVDYERVSIQEAKMIHDGYRPTYKRNWDRVRLLDTPDVLLDATRAWLLKLPETARPVELVKRFPRIANELGKCWPRPAQCERYMADLLIVGRRDIVRQGFPVPVVREIAALSSFYAILYPPAANAWNWSADEH